ncbi:MAG TPA: mechanosensitive ion channel domain-containing protein [Dinghuibacter sp.]|uniref:mechanosensitive ion channel family protein n=1 Tax=Dinghuibacter sp. TaxID=2024697 RepID=UPI002C26EF9C|nr:mechanosensitive ion channel domain-containing protein [Dinghuibacter sp.]HTJ11137.1 mechanosensitive ion channel domain-containing protein [Dinghuibacter sp.]
MLPLHLPDIVFDLLLFAAAFLAGLLVKWLFAWLSRRAQARKRDGFSLWTSVLCRLGEPINVFIPLLLVNLLVPFMRLGTPYREPIHKIFEIFFDISVAFFLIALVKVAEDYLYHRYDISKPINLRERKIQTQLQFIRKLAVGLILTVTVCVILLSFEALRKMGASLLTGVGVGGIIIGFAAQKSLGDLLAGFQIAFTQPIRIDDVLVVEGEWGRVEEITLTYVVLHIWDHRRLILPISYFIEKPFQNWTRTSADLLAPIMFYLDYTAPVNAIRAEVNRVLVDQPQWDGRVSVVQVTDLRERVMEVRILLSARNSGDAFDLRCNVRERVIAFLQEHHPECLPVTRVEPYRSINVS